ncbi:Ras small GTPase family Ras protein [Ceratobasidium sp. AG-Ba]|nr:Ras small GTPase family Ras protein [Ceratobasidium sp. AG-Ba]QRW15441.1 Ras small GTPase family Ras protein [Ceratobasidium sp. AG-Ba]
MVDLNQSSGQQSVDGGDPLGVTGSPDHQGEASFSPSLPPYTPLSSKSRLITVTYCPPERDQNSPHTALIPWTANYETALASAKEALQRYFPSGSANRHRWLATRHQTSSGVTWAEFSPQIFPSIVDGISIELRLCEEAAPKLDVSVLPIGHEHETADMESFYQFKIITVGQRSVGKSMMLQSFTRKEEERLDTLSSTVGSSMDIANRFMTAHGELVKTILWDTAGQEAFRAMIKPLYRGTNGVFLVYSIADPESFNQCDDWLTEIRSNVDENIPIMLIGNQLDRADERAVQTSDAQAFALEHDLLFAEVSGKKGTNLEFAFQRLVHEIFNRLKDRDELYRFKETKRSSRAKSFPGAKPSWSARCCAS